VHPSDSLGGTPFCKEELLAEPLKGMVSIMKPYMAVAAACALAMGLFSGSESFAKGHNQGMDSLTSETPGTNVGSETVTNSQTEGAAQGNGKTAAEAGGNLGNSGNAGRSSGDNDRGNTSSR
jgi:hypothetical protein